MLRDQLVGFLDRYFALDAYGPDAGMSRHVPATYGDVDWRGMFEPGFNELFNGLMIKGGDKVEAAYCACFPTPDVIARFLEVGSAGDLLFLHHPIDMETGDAEGAWGRGFLPISIENLDALRDKNLSVYACHLPLDCHEEISTTQAMVGALDGRVVDRFYPVGPGYAGVYAEIPPMNHNELTRRLQAIYDIPYIDFAGPEHDRITKLAVCGGVVSGSDYFEAMESSGIHAFLTGDFRPRIEGERGRTTYAANNEWAAAHQLGLYGVSHAASEYLVMETQMVPWLWDVHGVAATGIPQEKWWR